MKNLYFVFVWGALSIACLNQGYTKDAVYLAPGLMQRFQNLSVQFKQRVKDAGFLIAHDGREYFFPTSSGKPKNPERTRIYSVALGPDKYRVSLIQAFNTQDGSCWTGVYPGTEYPFDLAPRLSGLRKLK
ncbi:MAG: hypothetical protein HY074_01360 [Deltaproteobacteria bacterium]|nr:hypothetical protein [Deltaproteobacteria bacterium]